VAGHQREGVDGAAAAGEDVDRAAADRRDHPVHVVGVLLRRALAAFGPLAPAGAARVVGHHRAVREVVGQGREPAGVHG
jgi:hypothetical protein